jgi:hypothetical protein
MNFALRLGETINSWDFKSDYFSKFSYNYKLEQVIRNDCSKCLDPLGSGGRLLKRVLWGWHSHISTRYNLEEHRLERHIITNTDNKGNNQLTHDCNRREAPTCTYQEEKKSSCLIEHIWIIRKGVNTLAASCTMYGTRLSRPASYATCGARCQICSISGINYFHLLYPFPVKKTSSIEENLLNN